MPITARFVHANIVAHDWKRLADFYQHVFDCTPVPPERHLTGPGIDAATNIPDTEIAGAGNVTFVYVTDPEGNIIELQKWSS